MTSQRAADDDADVIVVGAGPAGSAAAHYLAATGAEVLLLEKATFPRDKVCGDGLTPRAVREVIAMGVPIREQDGWIRNRGLRVIGGGHRLHLEWPELAAYPDFGLARSRMDLDATLARHAQRTGATLVEGVTVTGPVLEERTGRVVGVTTRAGAGEGGRAAEDGRAAQGGRAAEVGRARQDGRAAGRGRAAHDGGAAHDGRAAQEDRAAQDRGAVEGRGAGKHGREPTGGGRRRTYRAPVVIAADGVSSRLATAVGIEKRVDRPMGVAVRTYFRTPRHADAWMESHLELWEGTPGRSALLPGYGWIFALGDGTANVGLGSVSSRARATRLDYRDLFARWMANAPAEWEFTPENQVGPLRGAALPMAFNRTPHYDRGLLLVGDAGGMTSPFNGEGIAYALQAGRVAADVVAQALARTTPQARERVLRTYPERMRDDLGGYYTLGRLFVRLIEHPEVMRICTRYGLPRPTLMRFTLKLLSDSYDRRGGDTMDRVITALTKIAPAA